MKQLRRLDAVPKDPYRRALKSPLRSVSNFVEEFRALEREHPDLIVTEDHSPLIGQVQQVAKVFNRMDDKAFMDRLVAHALAGTRFLGTSDDEVLEKGLAVNAPNFWWYFMYLFGYSAWLTFFPAIVLLSISLFCGYKLYAHER